MGLDKLNLTIYEPPDTGLLEEVAYIQEKDRNKIYKYFCNLGPIQFMWKPHKYGPEMNEKMAYTKVDCSPKYFTCFQELMDCVQTYFLAPNIIALNRFTISRVDVKADIENIPLDIVLARLYLKGSRRDSLRTSYGSIYLGKDPMTRIYDKLNELKHREKEGAELTEWEKQVLKDEKHITRFEVEIKRPGLDLEQLVKDPESLVSYLERLEFYDFEDDENITATGGLQFLLRNTTRSFRKALDAFRTEDLKQQIREKYLAGVATWFDNKSRIIDDVPF